MNDPSSIDVRFDVPFTHRLRFTADVLGADASVLIDLLQSSHDRPARVLAVVETGVEMAAGISTRLRAVSAGRFDLIDTLVVDGGEPMKNDPARLVPVLQKIMTHGVDRQNYVLVAGGGAVLDAVGFAAALAHRGVRLVRLPTTTLAQADSGVGVKNAINFFGRKNWLGTFTVPWAVVNDRHLLHGLSDRDWRCGFAEAVKVSLLKDPVFFDRLCVDAKSIRDRDWPAAGDAIRRSAFLHLDHITRGGDPFELLEARPLDFGHWLAHRLEPMTGYTLRHGEAVAIGLAVDSAYSSLAHGLPAAVVDNIIQCLTDLGIDIHHPKLADADDLLGGLEEFRQHLGGRLTVTVLEHVGRPVDVHEIDQGLMREAIKRIAEW